MYDYNREGSALCPLTSSQEAFLDAMFDEEPQDNDCDIYQIGGICTEKNCKNCVNHSGFCPVD